MTKAKLKQKIALRLKKERLSMPMITARQQHYPREINDVKSKITETSRDAQFQSLSNFMRNEIVRIPVVEDSQKCLRLIDLFECYKKYSKENGYEPIKSRTTFQNTIKKDFGVKLKKDNYHLPAMDSSGNKYKGNRNPKVVLCENIHLKSKADIDKDIKKFFNEYVAVSDGKYTLTTIMFSLFLIKFPGYKGKIDIDSFVRKFGKVHIPEVKINTSYGYAHIFRNAIPKYEQMISLYRENPTMVKQYTVDEAVELKKQVLEMKTKVVEDIRKARTEKLEQKKEGNTILESLFTPVSAVTNINTENTNSVKSEDQIEKKQEEEVIPTETKEEPSEKKETTNDIVEKEGPIAEVYTKLFKEFNEYKHSVEYQKMMALNEIANRLKTCRIHQELEQMYVYSVLRQDIYKIKASLDIEDIYKIKNEIMESISNMESFHK